MAYDGSFLCLRQHSVAGSIMFSGSLGACVSVCPCIPNVVNTLSWKVLDTFSPNFQHGAFWDRMNALTFGIKRSEVQSHGGVQRAGKCTFWVLLMWYLENYRTEYLQTFGVDAFWDKDERFKFLDQKFKGQGYSVTKYAKNKYTIFRVCFCSISEMHWWIISSKLVVSASCDNDNSLRFGVTRLKVKVIGRRHTELDAVCWVLTI